MTEKPIMMTPGNRVAINEDRKWMTRRQGGLKKINEDPANYTLAGFDKETLIATFRNKRLRATGFYVSAPYAVGTKLWIKEPHYRYGKWVKNGVTKKTKKQAWKFIDLCKEPGYFGDALPGGIPVYSSPQKYHGHTHGLYKRLARFMPKKFARTWLLVTEVKAPERVQDISAADARAEGIDPDDELFHFPASITEEEYYQEMQDQLSVSGFRCLWDSIYGNDKAKSWAANPWTWPITFKEIGRPE